MRSVLLAATVGAAALSVVVSPMAASAGPSPSATTSNVPPPGKSCVVHLAAGGTMSCYNTFTKAIADATGGKITDAPLNAATAVASKDFNDRINALAQVKSQPAAADAQVVIEISYQYRDYTGDDLIWGTSSGCDADTGIEWQAGSMPTGWNDRISSFRTFSRCQSKHWENTNFQGASTGFWNSTSYIGDAMNNQTSSIKWR